VSTIARCQELAATIAAANPPPMTIMEVCGTHSHAIARYGLKQLLPDAVRFVSGPGCPVCVTADSDLDAIVQIAAQGAAIATFGDMVRVPGPRGSLAGARAAGADIRVLYSPLQSLQLAREDPARQVVLLGIGFETTVPSIAVTASEAARSDLDNFSIYCAHKLVPPALKALVEDPEAQIDAFLCPGHVSTIIGVAAYEFLAADYGIACAVGGFGPTDILEAVYALIEQIKGAAPCVQNCYTRAVEYEGNTLAQSQIAGVFAPTDAEWRGLGAIPASGLRLRDEYSHLDARNRYELEPPIPYDPGPCICGAVLQGKALPAECPAFGTRCTPASPIGPCMVSSEGSCAAMFKYRET
jgi:hydrogenase expression/formation protein HypD